MNAALTNLQTKVDDNIGAKKTAAPDPSKVKAEDLDEVLTGVISYLSGLSSPPDAPAGVSFTTSPTFTIGTNSITESASVVNDNGVTVNVAGATIAVPYAATGKKRLDSIVVNYLATPAVYERIAGDEVLTSAIAARKPIPANRLFAHDIDVTDGAISTSETPGYTDAQAIAANASAIAAKLDIEVATATGAAIAFTTDKFYNTSASPATGNITITTTGGKPGVVVLVVHNSGTAPLVNGAAIGTAANTCKLVDGSQTYKLGVNNYFEFRYFSSTEIHYSIYQLKP